MTTSCKLALVLGLVACSIAAPASARVPVDPVTGGVRAPDSLAPVVNPAATGGALAPAEPKGKKAKPKRKKGPIASINRPKPRPNPQPNPGPVVDPAATGGAMAPDELAPVSDPATTGGALAPDEEG